MKLKNVVGTFLVVVFGFSSVFKTTYAEASDDIVFFHTDILGSAVAAVNEQGDLCWHESYSPYGEKVFNDDVLPGVGMPAGCGLLGDERGFTSHTQDYDSNLVYAQQRYYDPSVGRFLSIDPLSISSSDVRTINRYSYAVNNPYRYTDPTGENAADGIHTQEGTVLDQEIANGMRDGFRNFTPGHSQSDSDEFRSNLARHAVADFDQQISEHAYLNPVSLFGGGVVGVGARGFFGSIKGFFANLFGKGAVGSSLRGIDDILANPNLLVGKTPSEVKAIIGKIPGWVEEPLRHGSQAGNGWVFRQYTANGNLTGQSLRWHPGGGRKGPDSYWRVTSHVPGVGKSGVIR